VTRRVGIGLALCAAVLVLGAALRIAWFPVADRSPDEQLYAGFARGINTQGLAWFPHTVRAYVGEENADVEYPWVHRAGFLSLVALAQRLSGHRDPVAGEMLSVVGSILALALTGWLAWKLIGPLAAPLAMLFLAVSPLDLAISRRAWQDTVVELCTLVLVALILQAVAAARPGRLRVAFYLLGPLFLLVKESVLIPFGLGVLVLAWDAWRRERSWRAALVQCLFGALSMVALALAIVALSGGFANLVELVKLTPAAWAPDDYLRDYQTGGIGYYVTGLRILHAVPWTLGFLAAVLAVLRIAFITPSPRTAAQVLQARLLGGYVLVFLAVACAYGSKNMRFLSPLYPAIAILAAMFVAAVSCALRERVPRAAWRVAMALVVMAMLGSAFADAKRFDHYFNELQIQDLATPWFTKADAGTLPP